jgi:hypothetical protein
MSRKTLNVILYILIFVGQFINGSSFEARYGHYRLYTIVIRTQAQLEFFQELEIESENYMFYIRPLLLNRIVAFIVTAHKVPEIEDVIERLGLEATVMVSFENL